MNKSSIEWCDFTWNPVSGCSKVSGGCKNCYAEGVANRFWGDRKFTDVICHEDRLDQPLRRKKGARIFVNSMSDLFHEDVPFEFIDKVMAVVALCPQHTFIVLTKRPERMAEYFNGKFTKELLNCRKAEIAGHVVKKAAALGHDVTKIDWDIFYKWPLPNLWLLTSVEDQPTANRRIPKFLDVPAVVHGVSYEPALGAVDFTNIVYPKFKPTHPHDPVISYDVLRGHMKGPDDVGLPKLDWIIAGGESGPGARPSHPDFFRQVRDQCIEAGVSFFFKQWGEWGPGCSCGKSKNCEMTPMGQYALFRCGKKAAGRLLDGQEWNQFPEVTSE